MPAGAEIFTVLLLIKMGKFQSGIKGKEIKIPVTPCYRYVVTILPRKRPPCMKLHGIQGIFFMSKFFKLE